MDLNAQEIITALPTESIIKTALVSIGTNADNMQPTTELFLFLEAYGEVQNTYNEGTLPGTISTIGNQIIEVPLFNSQGVLQRNIRRQVQFKENFEPIGIDPLII